jgi:hypothetical protein
LLPFLRHAINGLKSGKFQPQSLSIANIFLSFKESAGYAGSQNSARLLEVYQPYFLKHTNEEDISIVLPKIIEIIEDIGKFISGSKAGNMDGCAILIWSSKKFFAGPEWKKLAKSL